MPSIDVVIHPSRFSCPVCDNYVYFYDQYMNNKFYCKFCKRFMAVVIDKERTNANM